MPVKLLKINEARTVELHGGFLESWFSTKILPPIAG